MYLNEKTFLYFNSCEYQRILIIFLNCQILKNKQKMPKLSTENDLSRLYRNNYFV